MVDIRPPPAGNAGEFRAARTDPDHPWAKWVAASIARGTGGKTVVLPNSGGSICNYIFQDRSEEHTSELPSLMRISYAVFCLKKKTNTNTAIYNNIRNIQSTLLIQID